MRYLLWTEYTQHVCKMLLYCLLMASITANGDPVHSESCHTLETTIGSIRITSPMPGWILQVANNISVSYFSLCSCRSCATANCSADDNVKECETEVILNGRIVHQALLSSDNHFSHSTTIRAHLPVGGHELQVNVRTSKSGRFIQAAVSHFSVAADRHALGLSIDPGWERPRPPQTQHTLHESESLLGRSARRPESTAPSTPPPAPPPAPRSAVMLYHRDLERLYPARWVRKCIASLLAQTHAAFDVWELDYGGGGRPAMAPHLHLLDGRRYTFLSRRLASHAAAMNFLLDAIFESGYDVAFNVFPPTLLLSHSLSLWLPLAPFPVTVPVRSSTLRVSLAH